MSGSIRAPNLTTTALSIKISGSGTITANSTANDQYLEISGSGRYLAYGLTSKTVKARISGSGTASVAAMDVLDVKISGSGSLTYAEIRRSHRRSAARESGSRSTRH